MNIPRMSEALPEWMAFLEGLAADVEAGRVSDWPSYAARARAFYTPEMMARIEPVVPGWERMATFANQQTLIHVTSVLTALLRLEEYQQADAQRRAVMEWIVLFHDIAKEARRGSHDYVHGFRSAAMAGRALAGLGFPAAADFGEQIDGWYDLTVQAVTTREDVADPIQDNRQLEAIVSGIERLYGLDSPAYLIVMAVLLHLSVDLKDEYPTVAPLDDAGLKRYVTPSVLPYLKMMLRLDNEGWLLFDPADLAIQRERVTVAFDRIARLGE